MYNFFNYESIKYQGKHYLARKATQNLLIGPDQICAVKYDTRRQPRRNGLRKSTQNTPGISQD